MHSYIAVVERYPDAGLYVGYASEFSGSCSHGESLEEPKEVIAKVLDGGVPAIAREFVDTQLIVV